MKLCVLDVNFTPKENVYPKEQHFENVNGF